MMNMWVIGALCVVPAVAVAQTTEWKAIAKLINGNCREGLEMTIVEALGTVTIKSPGNGRDIPPSERVVRVGADGSGTGKFSSPVFGEVEVVVPPGRGKRLIRNTQQNKGICQWEYR